MPTVAEMLRSARESRGLTVQQVAEMTMIKTEHVRDLDSGHYEGFAAPVYIRGFVRTYATALHLDVAKVLETLDAELSQTKQFRAPPSLSGERKGALDFLTLWLSRVNWRIMGPVVAVLLLLAGLVAVVRMLNDRRSRDPLAGLPPALYQPRLEQSGEVLALPQPRTTNSPPVAPGRRRP